MDVLFLVTWYPSGTGDYGGVFHRNLAEAIVRRGTNVQVVAPVPWVPPGWHRWNARWLAYRQVAPHYSLNGVVVHRPRYLALPRGNKVLFSHHAFRRLGEAAVNSAKPDIVHAHYAYPPGFAACQLARRLGIPWVLTLHGGDVNVFPENNYWSRQLFRTAVRAAPRVFAVSRALAERTDQVSGRLPTVLPIGVRLNAYGQLPNQSSARLRLGLPLWKRLVLFVGNLVKEKGVDVLLQALKLSVHSEILGLFVGAGPMGRAIEVSAKAKPLGIRANEEIPCLLAASDLFVLPSLTEGMPTVLVEAGAAGVPVIATSVGGIPELLNEKRGYLVPPEDATTLAKTIDVALNEGIESRRRAAHLKDFIHAHYNIDHNASTLVACYRDVIRTKQ